MVAFLAHHFNPAMITPATTDGSRNMSEGLHNLLSGLTVQSPTSPSSNNANDTRRFSQSIDQAPPPPHQPLFNTPNRSIFSPGPPTSSLSVTSAQAPMSATTTTGTSHPLAALNSPPSSDSRSRCAAVKDESSVDSDRDNRTSVPTAEKDVDDPTTPIDHMAHFQMRANNTPRTLNRLFAATSSAAPSRQPSFNLALDYTRGEGSLHYNI